MLETPGSCVMGYRIFWQHNTESAFLGPEETFSAKLKGVYPDQQRTNNGKSLFLFCIQLVLFWKSERQWVVSCFLILHSSRVLMF